jgi:hypothetical protein
MTEQHRKKNFKAIVKKDRDGLWLSITRNGHQWHDIELNHSEMAIVIDVLKAELEKK